GAAAVAEPVRSKRHGRRGAPARPQHVHDREGAPRAEPAALATDEGAVEKISTAPSRSGTQSVTCPDDSYPTSAPLSDLQAPAAGRRWPSRESRRSRAGHATA